MKTEHSSTTLKKSSIAWLSGLQASQESLSALQEQLDACLKQLENNNKLLSDLSTRLTAMESHLVRLPSVAELEELNAYKQAVAENTQMMELYLTELEIARSEYSRLREEYQLARLCR